MKASPSSVTQKDLGPMHNINEDSRLFYIIDNDDSQGVQTQIDSLNQNSMKDVTIITSNVQLLEQLQKQYPVSEDLKLGNNKGVRLWQGELATLPSFLGPVNSITYIHTYKSTETLKQDLLYASLLLQPGRTLSFKIESKNKDCQELIQEIRDLVSDLALQVMEIYNQNNSSWVGGYLQVPDGYRYKNGQVEVQAKVVRGSGIGGKDMKVNTANLDVHQLASSIDQLTQGVYFGFAQLQSQNVDSEDRKVFPCVLNYGIRPTIEDNNQRSFEVHILHGYAQDFYGEEMKVMVLGHLRPEIKYPNQDQLVNRIKKDIGLSVNQLKSDLWKDKQSDKFFS